MGPEDSQLKVLQLEDSVAGVQTSVLPSEPITYIKVIKYYSCHAAARLVRVHLPNAF